MVILVIAQNHLSTGLAGSSKMDTAFSGTNSTIVAKDHKAKVRDNEREVHSNAAKLGEVRQLYVLTFLYVHFCSVDRLVPPEIIYQAKRLLAGPEQWGCRCSLVHHRSF